MSFDSETDRVSASRSPVHLLIEVGGKQGLRRSARSVGEGGPDRRTGVQSAEHDNRGNCLAGELGGHIWSDTGQAQDMDVQLLPGVTRRLQIFAAVLPQTQIQALSISGALDHLRVAFELIPDRRPNEIGAVRIKALPDHEIDLAQVDVTDVDRDLLGIARLRAQIPNVVRVHAAISRPSSWMIDGWQHGAFKAGGSKKLAVTRGPRWGRRSATG